MTDKEIIEFIAEAGKDDHGVNAWSIKAHLDSAGVPVDRFWGVAERFEKRFAALRMLAEERDLSAREVAPLWRRLASKMLAALKRAQ
jgi:hypothetical protein